MRRLRRWIGAAIALPLLLVAGLLLWAMLGAKPQDLPWTPLDLSQPVGLFTGRKLAGLTRDFPRCRALLDRAGIRYTALAEVREGQCGYGDGVRLDPGGSRQIGFVPSGVGMACPVAAALALWEWDVIQPAAFRHFGVRVTGIEHFGSYNCRRIYGRSAGPWSEHATADAFDVAGFRLADGREVSVLRDWPGKGPKPAFLREVRDGACRLYATVLSPDYNAAHANHLHLDQAARGEMGWRMCR